ncbi:nuclear pore complex protein Nup153-like [Achroia grisella]|uniref:nuclear pore complex protein Nup153-like n=1 Tax=Achroia grisella TaxID=688607 RepID=UPI0027D2113C|nr:nuclear pore complex protein Nup153-like [Achroia grisella]
MSKQPSRNKKRSFETSEEADNSFVKKVKRTVSHLLPETITKWFSSTPSSSNANGPKATADDTDSSTEDEAPQRPRVRLPPAKRMRYSPGYYNYYSGSEITTTEYREITEPYTSYNTIQTPPRKSSSTRDAAFIPTPQTSPNEEVKNESDESDNNMIPLYSEAVYEVPKKRKSLFNIPESEFMKSCRRTALNASLDLTLPYYKPSLLVSSFYCGRTAYGGAASHYVNQPNIKRKKTTLVNQTTNSDNSTMSHSARRVMDLLEQCTSPLKEAQRIPTYKRNATQKPSSNTSLNSSCTNNKTLSYKTQELHVPAIASVLHLRKRSRLMDTTNAARQIIASHSSASSDYQVYNQDQTDYQRDQNGVDNSKRITKMKSRLTKPKGRGRDETDYTIEPPLSLPKAFLRIDHDNLPKFTFDDSNYKPSAVSTPKSGLTSVAISRSDSHSGIKASEDKRSKPENVSGSNAFKFSIPVMISPNLSEPTSTIPKFTFGSPERGIDRVTVDEMKNIDSSILGASKEESNAVSAKPKDWQCPDCWVSNKTNVGKCVCCGYKKPTEIEVKQNKCSVCNVADKLANKDKCMKCQNMSTNCSDTQLTLKANNNTIKNKCPDCGVYYESNVEKCVQKCLSCGALNSKKIEGQLLVPSSTVKSNDWTCDDCWIKNKSSVDKCAACGGAKPGAKQNSTPALKSDALTLAFKPLEKNNVGSNIEKSQSEKWECNICLVYNDSNRSKCVCCESERPGTVNQIAKFNFGVNKNTFKFGINPNFQAVNIPKQDDKGKEESETNNNVLSKTPTFTFGIPPQTEKDKIKDKNTEQKVNEGPKFSFGIPTATKIAGSLNIANVSKLPDPVQNVEEKEKLQEVPRVELILSAQPVEKPLATPIFGSILNTDETPTDKTLRLIPEENKGIPDTSLSLQKGVTVSDITQPPKKFSFTGSTTGTMPAVNLCVPSELTATTTVSFPSSLQMPPVTSTVNIFQKPAPSLDPTSLPLFQKNEPQSNSSVSLFQKPEPVSTAAPPPSIATTASLWTLGANSKPSVPQSENPKYNFNFGTVSNSNEASPFQFKLQAFAGSSENASPNKFTFSGGTNNPLSSNPLGSGNVLTGASTLGNTLTAGNALSSGNLPGSSKTPANPLSTGNDVQSTEALSTGSQSLFGAPVQKERNIWPTANSTSSNLFSSNAVSNPSSSQKPAAFTFGTTSPFNNNANNNAATGFGNVTQSAQIFMSNQSTNNQQSIFSTPAKPPQSIFGTPQASSSPTPSLGMFGAPNVGSAPTFGTSNPSIPSFEAPSLTPASAPTFNFGSSQNSGIFGFGQQQQSLAPQQPAMQPAGMYNFGAGAGGAPQVQFNMGSSPNAVGRRVRKAIRRNPQR